MKEYLGFAEGMIQGMGRDHSNKDTFKVFDWKRAAKLIRDNCMIGNNFDAGCAVYAGLMEDWGCTSGLIFENGNFVLEEDTYCYLSSSWATPILDINGEEIECWVFAKDSEYNSDTYWPQEALAILFPNNANTKNLD